MLLAVDIGNSNIVLGLFQDQKLEQKWRLLTELNKNTETYAIDIVELFLSNGIDCLKINGIIISSVVPALTGVICDALKKIYHGKIMIVGNKEVKLGLSIELANRDEIGSDRLVNAVAGYHKFGGNLLIIDFGTANTFDVVGNNGQYMGGVITVGVNLALKALHDMTAKLPKIKAKKQNNIIGKSTSEAMNSGIYYGYISMIEGMIQRIKKEYGHQMTVIFTGGLSTLFEDAELPIDHYDPDLTLTGLAIIYQQNKSI